MRLGVRIGPFYASTSTRPRRRTPRPQGQSNPVAVFLAFLLVTEPCAYGPLSYWFVPTAAGIITGAMWVIILGTLFWHELR